MPKHAVLLGRNSGRLEHCPRDVNLMHEALRSHGFDCRVIPADASAGQVQDAIVGVIDVCRAEDTLLLYFSGHSYGQDGLQLILADPMDALANRLLGSMLVGWLKNCRAQSKLLILDSCQSGQAVPDDWPSQPGDHFRVLTAADGRSLTKEHSVLQAGVFTHHLHLALTDPELRHAGADGVLTDDGHLSIDSLYPWLRRAVSAYDRIDGKQAQAEPQLYGSVAKAVFLGTDLAMQDPADPPSGGPDHPGPGNWDGYLDDPWPLKTLDRTKALEALRALLRQPGKPHLALVDAVYETDRPDYLADCAMLWPERRHPPIPGLEEPAAPMAYELDLGPDLLEPADLYHALHDGALLPQARDADRPKHAVCKALGSHRHAVLCCMLRVDAPSLRYLRWLAIAQGFLAELCRAEPDLAVVLLVVCLSPQARRPWWWPVWMVLPHLALRRHVHHLGRLGRLDGTEVAAWKRRWPPQQREDPRVRLLHDAQVAKLNATQGNISYEEMRVHLRGVWEQALAGAREP